MYTNKKALSSVLLTLSIIAMLILIQPTSGLQVSLEDIPSSCKVGEKISFKAKITIQGHEWANIQDIKLVIERDDGKKEYVSIPVMLSGEKSFTLTNISGNITVKVIESETTALYGYGYGYGYINGGVYGPLTYGYGYGYGYYGYFGYGYGYGYNAYTANTPACIVYNITWIPEESGTYTIRLTVESGSVKFESEPKTITVESAQVISGAYGRAAVSAEETERAATKTEIKTMFEPGKPVKISLPWDKANELGILGLMLEYQSQVQAKVMITKLSELPSNIEKPNVKDLYDILEIKVIDEATGKEIEPKGWIKFMVSKKWLEEKGYSPDDVVMLRYHNGWEVLETKKLGIEYEGNVLYEAYAPGFSIFAVAVKAEEEKPVEEQVTPTTEEEKPTKPAEEEEKQPTKPSEEKPTKEEVKETTKALAKVEETKGVSWTIVVVAAIILVIVGLAAYFFMGRK